MRIADTVSQRVINLCNEKSLSINKLAILGGPTQSTVQSLISGKSKNPKLLTIVRICDSLKISLADFFDDELFKDIDIEL